MDFYYDYYDAGLRLMLGHPLQNPKDQGPTAFGCCGAASFILKILYIRVRHMTEFALEDDPILGVGMSHNMRLQTYHTDS